MANDFANTSLVSKISLKDLLNEFQLAAKCDKQLDMNGEFSSKVGDTIKVRRPIRYTATTTETIEAGDISDIEEATVSVQLAYWFKVVKSVSSKEATINIEEANERYIKPAMEEIAQQIESTIASHYYELYNFVGTAGTTPEAFIDIASCKQKLDELGVPDSGNRCAFYEPLAAITLANGLKAVFPQSISTKAIENASIGRYAGFEIFQNQSLKLHTVGVATGTPLVNGDDQETTYALSKNNWYQTFNTDGWTNSTTGILKKGDVFTIADVYAVNRRTRESTGNLAQFTVLADVDSGASTGPAVLTISPPIITSGPYQTVDSSPADGATITVLTGTGGTSHRQNLLFHPNCFTLAFAQLDVPKAGVESYRSNYAGVSIRVTRQYDISLDKTVMRWDVLLAVKCQNPDFGVRHTS
jgi:hypothetical protein